MKHTVIRIGSPKSERVFSVTLCETSKPEDVNALRQILSEGGGITEVVTEIYEKQKETTVWRAK